MTLREQIEAASAKAAQGDWLETQVAWIVGSITELKGGHKQHNIISGNPTRNGELVCLLVNAYRQGKLLVIEDEQEAVRRMVEAYYVKTGFVADMNALAGVIAAALRGDTATAALAALRGDKA